MRGSASPTPSLPRCSSKAHPPATRKYAQAQRARADRLAETADPRQAIPFVMPRAVYLTASLLLVAGQPLRAAVRSGANARLETAAARISCRKACGLAGTPIRPTNQKRNPKQVPQAPDENGEGTDQDQAAKGEQNSDQQTEADGQAESEATPNANSKSPGNQQNKQPDSQMATDDQQEGGDNSAEKGDEGQDGEQGDGKGAQQPDKQQNGNKQDANNNNENSSLMDKMKDAFQNLISKVKPQQQQQNGQQQDQKGQQGKSQQGAKQQSKQGQQQNAGQQGDAAGRRERASRPRIDENTQQQKGQGKSDSQQATKQPGSGVGSQDGEKAIKNAEQLAAMGKLSEIMGKRSQTITGEATVEVQQHQPATAHQLRSKGRAALAGRRGDQPRRGAGGAAALRAAVLRAGSKAGWDGAGSCRRQEVVLRHGGTMRVRELAEWLGATFEGDGEKELTGVAPLETGGRRRCGVRGQAQSGRGGGELRRRAA